MIWLFEGNMTVAGYYRLPWYDTLEAHTALFAACGLVFLTALAGWSLQAWRGRDGLLPTPARLACELACAMRSMTTAPRPCGAKESMWVSTPCLLSPVLSASRATNPTDSSCVVSRWLLCSSFSSFSGCISWTKER